MGRRRWDERRAAAVRRRRRRVAARPPREARHRRAAASATPRPEGARREGDRREGDCRVVPEVGALLGEIVAHLDDLDLQEDPHDLDDLDDRDVLEEFEDDDEDDEDFDLFRVRVRDVVVETIRGREGEVARAFVAGVRRTSPAIEALLGPSPDRVLVDVVVGSWLADASRRHAGEDLARRAVAWVGEVLGERGAVVEEAARVLRMSGVEAVREAFLRTRDDVLVARLWVLAAVVALAPVDPVDSVDPINPGAEAGRFDVLLGP